MKAARFYQAKDIRVEEVDKPQIYGNQVLVKIAWAGICGSDLHEYNVGPIFIPSEEAHPVTGKTAPITMGHEFSGVIEEVGPEVKDFKIGDKVAVFPIIANNKKNESSSNSGPSVYGFSNHGGFAEYFAVPSGNLVKLKPETSLQLGALVEPSAVALQAIRESGMQFGETVAVFGVGPIGLLQIAAARAAGARDIFAFDLSEERLKLAEKMGASHAINSGNVNAVEYVKERYPNGVDRAFEVAGVEPTFNQAISVTRARGMVSIVSLFEKPIAFNPFVLTSSGVHVSSSFGYEPDIFKLTLQMLESGQLDVSAVITDEIELDNIVKDGFEQLIKDKSQSKILVKVSGEK